MNTEKLREKFFHDMRASEDTKYYYEQIFNWFLQHAHELQEKGEIKTPKVDRVEVIDNNNRAYHNWKKSNKVSCALQDEDRTLKIFISSENTKQEKGVREITDELLVYKSLAKVQSEKIKQLEFMIENGLGAKDMINDITYPRE